MSSPLVSPWEFSQLCQGLVEAGDPCLAEREPRSHAHGQQVNLGVTVWCRCGSQATASERSTLSLPTIVCPAPRQALVHARCSVHKS